MKIMLFGLCVLAMPIVFAAMPSADAECMQVFRQTRETMGSTNLAPLQDIDEAAWIWCSDERAARLPVIVRFKKEFVSDGSK